MKSCACGGDFLRHGTKKYKVSPNVVGIRYICRECHKSKTVRMASDDVKGVLFFNSTGRPTKNDWRHALAAG